MRQKKKNEKLVAPIRPRIMEMMRRRRGEKDNRVFPATCATRLQRIAKHNPPPPKPEPIGPISWGCVPTDPSQGSAEYKLREQALCGNRTWSEEYICPSLTYTARQPSDLEGSSGVPKPMTLADQIRKRAEDAREERMRDELRNSLERSGTAGTQSAIDTPDVEVNHAVLAKANHLVIRQPPDVGCPSGSQEPPRTAGLQGHTEPSMN